jgi:hypothetical protein
VFKSHANAHALKFMLAAACFGTLAACQSAPTEDKMAKTTTDTAPADLQLLCANAAATPARVEAAKILPVSSAKLDDQNYTVQLDASGKKFTCTVDVNGNVKSVLPAAAPA